MIPLRRLDGGLVDFAHELLSSDVPALGIHVARGVLGLCGPFEREILLDSLLEARDRLEVSPSDPVERLAADLELLENRVDRVEEVRRELEASVAAVQTTSKEIDRLRGEVGRLREELAERERAARTRPEPAAPRPEPSREAATRPHAAAAEEPRIAELRLRVKDLRSQLVERHAERNSLRRQLDGLRNQMDAAPRDDEASAEAPVDDDAGDWIEDSSPATHGVRIPRFAPGFAASLDGRPERTARATLALVGELAAGTPSAFRGARRLEHRRTIWRQKVGRDYRLLFRLEDDELEVLVLIHRQDLEKTLRALG